MAMETTVGEDNVSADITELDIWSDSLKAGRWRLLLNNLANKWGDDFDPNDLTTLKINALTMMVGYVDDVFPHLDSQGVYTNILRLEGRDYGRNFARLYYAGEYGDVRADDVIEDILTTVQADIPAGYRIAYTSLHAAPYINILRDRTFLEDWLEEISRRIDYDGYVDILKDFQYFHIDDVPASGVTLKSVAGALDNNILDLLKGEQIGYSIANCIELTAGPLRGHWTNENAVDFTAGAGCTVVDDGDTAGREAYKYAGMGSIRLYREVAGIHSMSLDFPIYSHTSLDLSKPTDMIVCMKHIPKNGTPPALTVYPQLEDSAGNVIMFRRRRKQGIGGVGHTEEQFHTIWNKVTIPLGEELEIRASGLPEKKGFWYYVAPAVAFDWTDVEKIHFTTGSSMDPCDIWIDFLCIPSVEVISLVESVASKTAYVKSMWWDDRSDILSQVELDVIAVKELDRRKNPLRKIRIFAAGQTSTKYAGQSVLVNAPNHGIAAATKYRIITLHHQVRKKIIMKGETFVTTYDLIKHEVDEASQVIDRMRFRLASDPRGTLIDILNRGRRREREAASARMTAFGDTHPMSQVFDELGVVHAKQPIYDPTGFHDFRAEEGVNEWTEAVTIKYPQYAETVYRIKNVAVLMRRTTDAAKGTMQCKAEVSWNEGVGWTQLGSTMECETAVETEYTAEEDLAGLFNQPLWIKFSYRIYQEGAGDTDGYLRDCEAREHYSSTKWEDVDI